MSDIQPLSQDLPDRSGAVQLSLFEPTDIARPEYNIGKWAGVIFISPHSRNVRERRTFEFKTKIEGGQATAGIVISPTLGEKTPTTTTFKVYLALIQLWNQQGRNPDGKVGFSDREIAAVANWSYSGAIAKRIEEHIGILAGTTIDWSLTFKTKEGVEEKVSRMHIIDGSSYINRSLVAGGRRFTRNHWVRFNPELVRNMINKLERPINFKELAAIRSENSSNLYVLLDIFLSRKPVWERNAFDLIYKDLGYTGRRYETRFARKQRLEEFKRDLDGRALVRGSLSISIYENSAGTDWKLVARRELPKISARTGGKRVTDQENAEHVAQDLIEQILRQPNSGTPRQGYLAWLALYVPAPLLHEALSIAKADYRGSNTKKTLTHIFVAIAKKLATERGIRIPQRHS